MSGRRQPVVFAGPSIFGLEDADLEGVDVRPPAGRGAILSAAAEKPPAIGLVDGVYEYEPAVWHKEILYALSIGIPVLGAASMGALRAAECAAFGMIGIGGIFEDYRDGTRTTDADVAVVHAPGELGYQPLTVALVDVEATLAALSSTGAIAEADRDDMLARARHLHFKQRTWMAICEDSDLAAAAEMQASRKAGDARVLLSRLRAGQVPKPPAFELNATGYLTSLARDLGIRMTRR